MKVHVDLDLCQSHAECVAIAPDVFRLDEDDVLVWQEGVDDGRRADMEAAVDACPMMAIEIEE